ncbi:synaptojanin-1 isoform X2 [Folsomia candida]|uniref:synaptojanin-1 isoform X2 n=1 Tax=Folsomia candida TaxID=158441 RepID=UPI000B8FB014|nr:synaptojanin-1 isoform X2 [Folsomia candida]
MALGKPFRVASLQAPHKFSIILRHRNKDDALLFESNAVAQLSAPEVAVIRKSYTEIIESYYGCLGVLQFFPEDEPLLYLVLVSGCVSVGKILDSEIYRITQTTFINLRGPFPEDERVTEIKKVLNAGTFYFSWSAGESLDLTLCEQRRAHAKDIDNRFFWNRTMFLHFLRYGIDCNEWLLKMTCGSVEIKTVYAGAKNVKSAVISRLSCERAGTRFNVRGTNDDGHVANFVETEQIMCTDHDTVAFIQTRGSVPLFWEQPGVQVGSHKVRLSRGPEAACSALAKHLQMLKDRYGKQAIVNLLGTNMVGSKEGEAMLSSLFHSQHTNDPNHNDIAHVLFDYHQEVRGTRGLDRLDVQIARYISEFGFYHVKDGQIQRQQSGTIRTNCLDCLDRTNCVQTFIGLKVLENQLREIGLIQTYTRFEEVFRQMWINNGNEVSKIYAGTGAIQGGSVQAKLMDGARSAARTIQNNLLDQSKQEAIDVLLLGHTFNTEVTSYARSLLPAHYLHAPPTILRQMVKRWEDYTTPKSLRVVVGTYNVNGGKHFRSVVYKDLSLSDWLLDAAKIGRSSSLVSFEEEEDTGRPADIYAVGFQEIVDLNASNIMAASTENQKAWAEELGKILNRDRGYVLLTSLQLVGVCLFIFTRPELLPHIKDVATDSVKTGLGGAAGNKGGVAIRCVVYSTSICFVCSHFAAGQSQVKERCDDFAEISRRILFPMGRTLDSHDYIFWCGDFNFRIDIDREEVKDLIRRQEWPLLLRGDQLTVEREKDNVFEGFNEGEINFAPTYKYDLFSEDYDTSEKCRIPAWTDRVLWKRNMPLSDMTPPHDWDAGRCSYYGRAELKQSDHRPVVAVIEIDAFAVDERNRDRIFKDVIKQLGPADATVILTADDPAAFESDDSDQIILNELSCCGDIILVRHLGTELWITFKDGVSALAAIQLETIQVGDYIVRINLKTRDWDNHLEKEMALCVNNCLPLLPGQNNNTIKGVSSYTNLMHVPEEPLRRVSSESMLGEAPNKVKVPPRPAQPGRPVPPPGRPPPPRSPQPERKVMMPETDAKVSKSVEVSPKQSPITEIFQTSSFQSQQSSAPPLPPKADSPILEQQVPPIPKRANSVESPKKDIRPVIPPAVSNYDPWESHQTVLAQQPVAPVVSNPTNLPPIPARQVGSKPPPGALPPIPARSGGGQVPPVPARGAPAIPPRKT